MKKIILSLSLCACFHFTQAQELDSLYTAMAEHIGNETWAEALIAANQISKIENKYNASIELIKVNSLSKLADLNEPNDPYFKQLESTLNYIQKSTKFSSVKELPLHIEDYEKFYQLQDYITFSRLKRAWMEDPNFQEGLKNYKIKNYGVAKTYFDKGHITNGASLLFLGMIYENGLGVKEDYDKAYEYYTKSFHIGNYDAAYHIGYCYFYGLGVVKNIPMSYDWCLLAANYNYAQAMIELSNRYEKGLFVEKNIEKASYWKAMATSGKSFNYIKNE